jgi:hypothetical protein
MKNKIKLTMFLSLKELTKSQYNVLAIDGDNDALGFKHADAYKVIDIRKK